jgi:predicted transposase YdaD
MSRDKAEKQKEKAKDMLGITDDRASEIFQETESRTQQKKKELEDEE